MVGMQKDCRNNPCRRITRTLVRAGVLVEDPEQPWLDLESGSTLEHLAAAAVRYRIAPAPIYIQENYLTCLGNSRRKGRRCQLCRVWVWSNTDTQRYTPSEIGMS